MYQGVKKALTAYLQADDKIDIRLEITADTFPETLKTHVQKELLFLLENKTYRPDLFGHIGGSDCTSIYGKSDFILTVEVKPRAITLKDIFQAKMYGEIYSTPFAFLISPERPKQRLLELIKLRPDFLGYSAGLQTLYFCRYFQHDETLDLWFNKREPRNKGPYGPGSRPITRVID